MAPRHLVASASAAVGAGGTGPAAHDRGILLERLAQGSGQLADDQDRVPELLEKRCVAPAVSPCYATLLTVCSGWARAIFIGPTCLYSRSLKPSPRAPARNKSSPCRGAKVGRDDCAG